MELYERILSLQSVLGNKSRIAKALEITPQKLNAYSCEVGQKNFLHRLPRLLKAIPDLNRDWLYFGDGPMFVSQKKGQDESSNEATAAPLPTREEQFLRQIDRLTETNRQLTESNRQLTDINRKLIEELMRRTAD